MKAIILAGGLGEKIWPYGKYRNKTMIPIGNQPIAGHLVDNLKKAGIMDIVIGAVHGVQEIKHYLEKIILFRLSHWTIVEELVILYYSLKNIWVKNVWFFLVIV